MKRYMLFCFSEYYPSGGWKDFVKDFDSIIEALSLYMKKYNFGDCVQIVDSTTKKVVFFKKR